MDFGGLVIQPGWEFKFKVGGDSRDNVLRMLEF